MFICSLLSNASDLSRTVGGPSLSCRKDLMALKPVSLGGLGIAGLSLVSYHCQWTGHHGGYTIRLTSKGDTPNA